MSIEKVREYMKQFGMEDKILEFDVSSATVPLAAQALGTEEARIAKSLSFLVEDKAIIIVTAGTARINNKRYKAIFHKKANLSILFCLFFLFVVRDLCISCLLHLFNSLDVFHKPTELVSL